MEMNKNIVVGKWTEIKGDLQKTWGKLTDNELEETKGDIKAIRGLLQQRYGEVQEDFGKKVSDIFEKFGAKRDYAVDAVKQSMK